MAAQLICNQWVAGSTPVTSSKRILRYTARMAACIVGFLLFYASQNARIVQQLLTRKSHQKRRRSSSGGIFYGEKWRMYQRSPAESGSIFQCKKRCFGRYSVGSCSVPVTRSHTLWDALIPGIFTYFRPLQENSLKKH